MPKLAPAKYSLGCTFFFFPKRIEMRDKTPHFPHKTKGQCSWQNFLLVRKQAHCWLQLHHWLMENKRGIYFVQSAMVHVNMKIQIHQKQGPFQLFFRCFTAPTFKERKTLTIKGLILVWSYLSFLSDSLIGSVSEQFIFSVYLFVSYTALK